MSDSENTVETTQHAFLVMWGCFAEHLQLVKALENVALHQKTYTYRPQTKVLEFLVAILAGSEHLQDISQAAHPLDKDAAVAQAWGQNGWADYSGVSRTMSGLSWDEARQFVQALEWVSEPYVRSELELLQVQRQRIRLDADLTGMPVSSTSRTYPNAAFGHMDDEIRLGYQAGVVSLESPTYRRIWLASKHLPGDTVSCTQAESLVKAAEARLGLRPRRRTDLLQKRIAALTKAAEQPQARLQVQLAALQAARQRLETANDRLQQAQATLNGLVEPAAGTLAKAQKRCEAARKRLQSAKTALQNAQRKLEKTQAQCDQLHKSLDNLYTRLAHFEQENAENPNPVEAEVRLDAGFGTYENIALLIEMGYEIYTKANNQRFVKALRKQTSIDSAWQTVGANAEMIAWKDFSSKHCPYPLDVALERFHTGQTVKHAALIHFGADPVTQDLTGWFEHYNGRQIIEAGIKECKTVFQLHHIKVRSEPAIYLQECFVLFAANFIRWACHWFSQRLASDEQCLQVDKLGIKRQVRVGAHVSAQVIRNSEGKLLRFSEHSTFAGKVLLLPGNFHPRVFQ